MARFYNESDRRRARWICLLLQLAMLLGNALTGQVIAQTLPLAGSEGGSIGGSIGGSLTTPTRPRAEATVHIPQRIARPPVTPRRDERRMAAPKPAALVSDKSAPAGSIGSNERVATCSRLYPNDYYSAWQRNHCSQSPYGPRFEYLVPGWSCLCL